MGGERSTIRNPGRAEAKFAPMTFALAHACSNEEGAIARLPARARSNPTMQLPGDRNDGCDKQELELGVQRIAVCEEGDTWTYLHCWQKLGKTFLPSLATSSPTSSNHVPARPRMLGCRSDQERPALCIGRLSDMLLLFDDASVLSGSVKASSHYLTNLFVLCTNTR